MRSLQFRALLSSFTMDWHTAKLTIKTSIPPAILVCAIQSDSWVGYFGLNSYLAPIGAAGVMAGLPQGMLFAFNAKQLIGFVVAYCWALLAGWCGVEARLHTTRDPAQLAEYNPSAEAVVALYVIAGMWFTFTVKSAFPDWNLQASVSAILAVAILPPLAKATSTQSVISQATNAFVTFVAGQAVGFVSALVIFPQTCRGLFKRDAISCLDALAAVMDAHKACVQDILSAAIPAAGDREQDTDSIGKLEGSLSRIAAEVSKAGGHARHARRELSWGSYTQAQLDKVFEMLIHILPAVSGLSLVADMMQRDTDVHAFSEQGRLADEGRVSETGEQIQDRLEKWHNTEMEMHEQLTMMIEMIVKGTKHAQIRLRQSQKRRWFGRRERRSDEENRDETMPGGVGFIESYRDVFRKNGTNSLARQQVLRRYILHRPQLGDLSRYSTAMHDDTLRYFALLHSQTILAALGRELQDLLLFLDDLHIRPKHLILPDLSDILPIPSKRTSTKKTSVELDPVFHKPRNPDHLPATNAFESAGDLLRKISVVLRTDHAAYGLRGACAVMTIAIIGFLHSSQKFYFAQRFLWALFAIILSMGRTSGSSTFLLFCRLFGTMGSMVASYVIWYIVDQKTPGVLVFTWLWFLVISYLMVRFPAFFSIWFVALVAAIVMIGIELQTHQIGVANVEAAGQAVYAPYIIFPYRLAVVALGVVTAYVWTIFPYPISEHSELRENTAAVLYELSRYYMCIQQTVFARLRRDVGDADDEASPSAKLQRALRRLFLKYETKSAEAKKLYRFLDWEFSVGGKFPRKSYKEILAILDRSGSYMALTSYLSKESKSPSAIAACWADGEPGTPKIDLTPHGIPSRVIILHSALGEGHPLPPGLHALRMTHLMEFSRKEAASDDEFAITALIHNVHWFFLHDVNRLTELVRDVVGELRFSFIDEMDNSAENAGTEQAVAGS